MGREAVSAIGAHFRSRVIRGRNVGDIKTRFYPKKENKELASVYATSRKGFQCVPLGYVKVMRKQILIMAASENYRKRKWPYTFLIKRFDLVAIKVL